MPYTRATAVEHVLAPITSRTSIGFSATASNAHEAMLASRKTGAQPEDGGRCPLCGG